MGALSAPTPGWALKSKGQGGHKFMKMSWAEYAKCLLERPPVFFYEHNPISDEIAKKFCVGCPVISPCLEHALRYDEYGVWGGTSERERNKIKTRRRVERLVLTPHISRRELKRPASAFLSSPVHISSRQSQIPEFFPRAVELPSLFGEGHRE